MCTSATKPVEKTEKKKTDGGFKTAPDGRLIITESSDDEGRLCSFLYTVGMVGITYNA